MVKHGTGQVFHVTDDESGRTLAAYLKEQIGGTSWAGQLLNAGFGIGASQFMAISAWMPRDV